MNLKASLRLLLPLLILSIHINASEIPRLADIVVTATKYPVSLSETGQQVSVITSEDFVTYGFTQVQDVLNSVSGLSVVNAGGARSLFMRGMASNKVKVLLDGVELRDAMSTQGNAYFDGLNLDDIERIEIVSGGMGTLYGSSAISGVIQLFSKESSGGRIKTSYTDDKFSTSMDYGYVFDGTHINFGMSRSHDNRLSRFTNTAEIDGINIENSKFSIKQKIGLVEGQLKFNKNTVEEDLDASGGIDDPNYVSKKDQEIASLNLDFPLNAEFKTSLQFARQSLRRADQNSADSSSTSELDTVFNSEVTSLKLDSVYQPNSSATYVFGAESKRERGESAEQYGAFKTAISPKIQKTHSLYGEATWLTPITNLRLGSRIEDFTTKRVQTGSVTVFRDLPLIDVGIAANYRTGYRHPGIYERYVSFGKEDLKPEESVFRELRFLRSWGPLETSVLFYENDITNLIDVDAGFNYNNLDGQTRSSGTEYGVMIRKFAGFDRLKIDYTRISSEYNGGQGLRIPKWTLNASAVVSQGPWRSSFTLRSVGPQKDSSFNSIILDHYEVADINISYRLDTTASLFVTLSNIWNEQYEEVAGYQTLGRTLSIGFSKTFI